MHQRDVTERFYLVVWPHLATVLRTAQFLTRNQADAEDLAQDTMMKAFRSLGTFRSGTDTKSWLLTILRNTRVDRRRSGAAKSGTVSLDEAPDVADSMTEPAEHPEAWDSPEQLLEQFSDEQIIGALKGLPEDICWTLILVDVERMDQNDAAEIMDVPLGTVKSRAHRGRAMLRAALTPLARQMRLIP